MMWSAGIDFDQRRLGHCAIFGLKSRDEAIAWLERAFSWERSWYLMPSCWIKSDT